MRVDAFDYELPIELIAQRPAHERSLARLMHVTPGADAMRALRVSDFPALLPAGTLVVVNDTRVFPARLLGRKMDTGGRVEVLLVRPIGVREIEVAPGDVRRAQVWSALGKGSKSFKFGTDIEVAQRHVSDDPILPLPGAPTDRAPFLRVRLLGRLEEDGLLEVALWTAADESIDAALRLCGNVPLPPYIKRDPSQEDEHRYQTVYARHDGAVAAPTAGLHLTDAILAEFRERGCDVANVTLHVGLGTFRPVVVDDLDAHSMHAERYVVSQATADAVAAARRRGARVVAIGTTTTRALESAADPNQPGLVRATQGETRLLIQPGYSFRVVDGLFTNFHLPRSTLLALVCAFGGTERVLEAYQVAVRERYRFFSYGDAMFLWRGA